MCTASAHHIIHIYRSCLVSLKSSCQELSIDVYNVGVLYMYLCMHAMSKSAKMAKIAILGEFDIVCIQRYIYKIPMLYTYMESSCCLLSNFSKVIIFLCFLSTQNWHAHNAIFNPSVHSCAHLCAQHIVHINRSCWVSLKSSHQDLSKTKLLVSLMLENS